MIQLQPPFFSSIPVSSAPEASQLEARVFGLAYGTYACEQCFQSPAIDIPSPAISLTARSSPPLLENHCGLIPRVAVLFWQD
jgi:hypothetical protein